MSPTKLSSFRMGTVLALLLPTIGCSEWGLVGRGTDTLDSPPAEGATYRTTGRASDRFPNIVLRSHDNQTMRFYDDLVKDRVAVINFMYSTCDGI